MSRRTWAIFIIVNVLVSAGVMLAILFIWERARTPAIPAPTVAPAATPLATDAALTSPTPATLPSPTPPAPLVYTVQEGDTLGGIAQTYGVSIEDLMVANGITDPHMLHPGQTLIISTAPPSTPASEPSVETPSQPPSAEAALPTPLPSLTPSGPPVIEIAQVLGSGDLTAEVVIVRNRGGTSALEGWTLSDAEGQTYTFPAITLFSDAQVRLHSAAGSSTPSDLYWGRVSPAWVGGALITLRDTAGNVVDTYIVP